MSHLRYLSWLAHSGVQHMCCVFCLDCLRLVYPMFPVSLDCQFLIAPSVFSNDYLPVSMNKYNNIHLASQLLDRTNFEFILNNILDSAPHYMYIGLLFIEYLNYNDMVKGVAKSGSRSLGLRTAKCKTNGGFQYSIFTKLADSRVIS